MGWTSTFPLTQNWPLFMACHIQGERSISAADAASYSGDHPRNWYFWQQFYLALREKCRGLGQAEFPKSACVLEEGTIVSATDTTITTGVSYDTTGTPWWNPSPDSRNYPNSTSGIDIVIGGEVGKPWTWWRLACSVDTTNHNLGALVAAKFINIAAGTAHQVVVGGTPTPGVFSASATWQPNQWRNYWVSVTVGGSAVYKRVLRNAANQITFTDDNPITGTSTPSSAVIDDTGSGSAFHFALIQTASELAGRPYQIIKYSSNPQQSPHWSQRWPESPFNAAGGYMGVSPAPGIFSWYRGYSKYENMPMPDRVVANDASAWPGIPMYNAPWASGMAFTRQIGSDVFSFYLGSDVLLFGGGIETDGWTPNWIEESNASTILPCDYCFQPYLYKTIRGLQCATLSISTSYLGPISSPWSYLPFLLPVDQFPLASRIAAGTTVKPLSWVWWAYMIHVHTKDFTGYVSTVDSRNSGATQADASGHWTSPLPADESEPATPVSGSVTWRTYDSLIASLGFTRKWAREVRNMFYRRDAFIPYEVTKYDAFGNVTYPFCYPPAASSDPDDPEIGIARVGRWVHRPIDTKYRDGESFATDEKGRYLGDTWDDDSWVSYVGAAKIGPMTADNPGLPYWANLLTKLYGDQYPTSQRFTADELATVSTTLPVGTPKYYAPPSGLIDVTGTALDGGVGWLRCSDTKGWGGTMVTHTGTATAGTTTTLTDTAQAGNPFFSTTVPTVHSFDGVSGDTRSFTGTITASATNSLTCAGSGWTVNQWSGGKLVVGGNTYTISSNTADTISYTGPAYAVGMGFALSVSVTGVLYCPDATGDNAWFAGEWVGAYLRLTIGGVAYSYAVTANTTDTLTYTGTIPPTGTPFSLVMITGSAGPSGRFTRFVIEVETSGGHYEPRVISGYTDGATQQFTWATALTERGPVSASAAGQLTCTSRAWTTDQWAGKTVGVVVGGTATTVTVASNTADTLTFDAGYSTVVVDAGSVFEIQGISANGLNYKIREPACDRDHVLNTWQDHKLTVTTPSGTVYTGKITESNDDHLWFTGISAAIPAGSTWVIEVLLPGTVWKWDGTAWVKPTGIDSRFGRAFPDDQHTILPTTVSYWGLYQNRDYLGIWLPNELHAAIIKMRRSLGSGGSWVCSSYTGGVTVPDYSADFTSVSAALAGAEGDLATKMSSGDWNYYTKDNYDTSIETSDWPSQPPTSTSHPAGVRHGAEPPTCTLTWNVQALWQYPPDYTERFLGLRQLFSYCYTKKATFQVNKSPILSGSATVFAYASKWGWSFDAFGSSFVENQWVVAGTTAASPTDYHYTGVIGIDMPTSISFGGPITVDTGYGASSQTLYSEGRDQGFVVTNTCVVIDWDMVYI